MKAGGLPLDGPAGRSKPYRSPPWPPPPPPFPPPPFPPPPLPPEPPCSPPPEPLTAPLLQPQSRTVMNAIAASGLLVLRPISRRDADTLWIDALAAMTSASPSSGV